VNLVGIEKALKAECKLHAFLSGGGLRVVRLETTHAELKGYGEHPQIEDALSHCNEDYLAGKRPYDEVYGGLKPCYLTGSSTPTGQLDAWLLKGSTFDAWQDGDVVAFRLAGYADVNTPDEICNRVRATGTPETWTNRGYTYEITRTYFANGEAGTCHSVVSSPEGHSGADPWMYRITKTGRGPNLWSAMSAAFAAEPVEVPR
jgi:hypothetical protein